MYIIKIITQAIWQFRYGIDYAFHDKEKNNGRIYFAKVILLLGLGVFKEIPGL